MEIWDGYLRDGTLAKTDLVRDNPIPDGLYHLVSEVLLRHADGDYLLMQRDFAKPNYGGWYEATAGGSALKGEDSLTCARRELLEETGLTADKCEAIGNYVSGQTLYALFLCTTSCSKDSVTLQKGETVSFLWVSEAEFITFIGSDQMIPVQKLRYTEYFKKMGYIR